MAGLRWPGRYQLSASDSTRLAAPAARGDSAGRHRLRTQRLQHIGGAGLSWPMHTHRAHPRQFGQAVLGAPVFQRGSGALPGQHALVQALDQCSRGNALLARRRLQRRSGRRISGGQAGDRGGGQGRGLPAAETIVAVGRAHAASQRKQAPMLPVQGCARRGCDRLSQGSHRSGECVPSRYFVGRWLRRGARWRHSWHSGSSR